MFTRIETTAITHNPFQTRTSYTGIDDLAASILATRDARPETSGLIQVPPARLVTPGDEVVDPGQLDPAQLPTDLRAGHYVVQLAAGHRRLHAFELLAEKEPEYATFPVDLVILSDAQMCDVAFLENSARQDVTAIEQAEAMAKAIQAFGYTHEQLAQRWTQENGQPLSRSTVSNKLRLLKLPEEFQAAIRRRELDERHGRVILAAMNASPHISNQIQASLRPPADSRQRERWEPPSAREVEYRLTSAVKHSKQELNPKAFPVDLPISGNGIHHARCSECPYTRTNDGKLYCLDPRCRNAKEAAQEQARRQQFVAYASQQWQREVKVEQEHYRGTFLNRSHTDDQLIIASGQCQPGQCSRCLVVQYLTSMTCYSPFFDEFPEFIRSCDNANAHHACAKRMTKAAAQGNDQETAALVAQQKAQQARNTETKRLRERAVEQVARAIEFLDPRAWAAIAQALDYSGNKGNQTLHASIHSIARHILEFRYNGTPQNESALQAYAQEIDHRLTQLGQKPIADVAARLREKLDRIERFITSTQELTPEQLTGNITNLENLTHEISVAANHERITLEQAEPLQFQALQLTKDLLQRQAASAQQPEPEAIP